MLRLNKSNCRSTLKYLSCNLHLKNVTTSTSESLFKHSYITTYNSHLANNKRFYSTDKLKDLIYYRNETDELEDDEEEVEIKLDELQQHQQHQEEGETIKYNRIDDKHLEHLDFDHIDNESDILSAEAEHYNNQMSSQSIDDTQAKQKQLLDSYRDTIANDDSDQSASPSDKKIESILAVENFRTRIKLLLVNGHFDVVMDAFNQSLNVHPDHRGDVYHLIELVVKYLILNNQYSKAERFLSDSVTLHPAFLESDNILVILRDLRYFDPQSNFIHSILNTHVVISQEQLFKLINIYLSISETSVINQLMSRIHQPNDTSPQVIYERLLFETWCSTRTYGQVTDLLVRYHKKHPIGNTTTMHSLEVSPTRFWQYQSKMIQFSEEHLAEQKQLNNEKQLPPLTLLGEIHQLESGATELYLHGMLPKQWMYKKEEQARLANIVKTNSMKLFTDWLIAGGHQSVSLIELVDATCRLVQHKDAISHLPNIVKHLPHSLRCIFINSCLFKQFARLDMNAAISMIQEEPDKIIYQNDLFNSIIIEELLERKDLEMATQIMSNPNCRILPSSISRLCQVFIDNSICPYGLIRRLRHSNPDMITLYNVELNYLLENNQLSEAQELYRTMRRDTQTYQIGIKLYAKLYPDVVNNYGLWKPFMKMWESDVKHTLYNTIFKLLDPNGTGENIGFIAKVIDADQQYFTPSRKNHDEYGVKSSFVQQYMVLSCRNQHKKKVEMFLDMNTKFSRLVLKSVSDSNLIVKNKRADKKIQQKLSTATQENIILKIKLREPAKPLQPERTNFLVKHYLLPLLEENESAIKQINSERKSRVKHEIKQRPWKYKLTKLPMLPGATNPFVFRIDSKVLKNLTKESKPKSEIN
ncbi:hypothetical protein PPL_02552 [Heterostelium album PN500]|uniref:Uncharacterized protein n=1 Tax=Heterostelium pallidum (strain ATCC 26659 / Pp 5 / PN500) TaxID=670386 RepID=D3B2E1_HETP5|nr:hypothetical protein PPL_02552 [Heterostelium album PN500]EFA84516.1 hypothetical protein PPL_02552 [Heterostelium album PN500]|eukprot:XP_020436629.1 hypothetical protein PPL_02552 [Heterostelium album PN500]